jgi:glycosidase
VRLQEAVKPATRWSPFLRNHDQPRTRTELGGSMAKSRVASFLLLTLPGLPFVYYGEEIGMTSAKPDERIRTPMQWTADRAVGFSRGTPWEQLSDDSLGTSAAAPLTVGADGTLSRYVPLASLAPHQGYLFELAAARR